MKKYNDIPYNIVTYYLDNDFKGLNKTKILFETAVFVERKTFTLKHNISHELEELFNNNAIF